MKRQLISRSACARKIAQAATLFTAACCLVAPLGAAEIDVYLVAGQSNAQGVARISNFNSDPAGVVPAGYSLSNPNVMLYSSAIGDDWTTLMPANASNFGPEIAMGNTLDERFPDRQIAIIKHAKGTTSLHSDWNSSPATPGAEWTIFANTVNAALQELIDRGDTPIIRGMAWQQGERDANSGATTQAQANAYGQNLRDLILNTRTTFNAPNMEFVYGRVLQKVSSYAYEGVIRTGQDAVDQNSGAPLATIGAKLIPSDDLTSDYNGDPIHLDYVDQLQLGNRFANAFELGSSLSPGKTVNVDFSRDIVNGQNPGTNPAPVLYTDVGPAPDTGTIWNDLQISLGADGTGAIDVVAEPVNFSNLVDSTGMATDIDVQLTSGFFRAFNSLDATPPAPDSNYALQGDRVFANNGGLATLTIQGLEAGKTYDLYLIDGAFTTAFTIDGVTQVAVGSNAIARDANWQVGADYVLFSGISPDGLGEIVVEIQDGAEPINSFGVISGLQIVEIVTSAETLGDFNGDGVVTLADYTVWRDNLGADESVLPPGSGDGSGTVDAGDYTTWKNNFGGSSAAAVGTQGLGAANVPEPSSLLLLGIIGLSVGIGRQLR